MRNELQKHKLSDKIKWVLTGIAFVLVFAVLAGLCMQLFAKDDKYKPSEWFTHAGQTETDVPDDTFGGFGGDEENITAAIHNHTRAMSLTLDEDENAGVQTYSYDRCPYCNGLSVHSTEYIGSCTSKGYIEYWCDDDEECGQSWTETTDYNHSYAWVITTMPVGSSAGVESYQCSKCLSVTQTRTVFALPAEPEKEGYHFVGWYKDEELTTPYNSDYIYGDINLYAKFEINVHTVTFDSDGGTEIDEITVEWNTVVTPEVPEKTGYNFVGWYTSDGVQFESGAITSDTILTARWQIKTFTVTFFVEGEIYATKQVDYGSVLSKVADELNLCIMSMSLETGEPVEGIVVGNTNVIAEEMTGKDKVINTIKNNKWKIVGGVAGCVALIVIIAAACGGAKLKKKS